MQLKIYKDYETLSLHVAHEIIRVVKNKPHAVLCLAAGDTPGLAYALMVQVAVNENIDVEQCTFIGLDEWVGIPPNNEGSCHYFLKTHVFDPLGIGPAHIHLFNSMASNLEQECGNMDKVIAEKGGIDLMVVGVGMNGHIGFNEPGVPFDKYSHVVDLDDTTQTIGQKYFTATTALKQGISLGLTHLSHAKKVLLIANGRKKAGVIRKALEEPIGNHMPASIIRTHKLGMVMIDEEAASMFDPKTFSLFADEN